MGRRGRRALVLAAAAGAAAVRLSAAPAPPAPEPPPNVILIVLDTVRADALGRRPGLRASNTPFLDAWSRHAIVFRDATSPSDFTPGSHFSMFTGYPASLYTTPADRPEASVVHQLNAAGYDTIGISANGSLDPSLLRSMEPFQSFGLSPAYTPTALTEEERDTLERHGVGPAPAVHGIEPNLAKELASARTINARLESLLASCGPDARRRPTFLFLNFIDAHDPYFPPRSAGPSDATLAAHAPLSGDLRRGRPESRPEPAATGEVPTRENVPRWRRSTDLAPADVAFLRTLYDGEVRSVDARLADTFRILSAHGLLRRAVVVVTSDHGEAFGEQGYLAHALEQHGIHIDALYRVPLIVRGYGLSLAPVRRPGDRVNTRGLADSIRSWAGLPGVVAPELEPIAVIARAPGGSAARSVAAPAVAPSAPATERAAPKSDAARARDEELARRLRSLGYLK